MQLRTIVVGVTDFGALEDPTMEAALQLAETSRAELHVVHAREVILPTDDVLPIEVLPTQDEAQAALERQVRGWTSYERVVCHAEPGSAVAVLRGVVHDVGADLLVVGAGHSGRFVRRLFGTTAGSMVRHPAVPTLVVHGPFRRPIRAVLLTTDLAEISGHAHRVAMDLVRAVFRADNPEIHSLMVVSYTDRLPVPLRGSVISTARRHLADFLKPFSLPPDRVTGWIRHGDPVREILRMTVAWNPDLVVVGTHSPHGLDRLMLGSVAAGVVRDATCNVLVVPLPVAEEAAAHSTRVPVVAQQVG